MRVDELEVVPSNLPNSVATQGSWFLSLSEAWQMVELPRPTQHLLGTSSPPQSSSVLLPAYPPLTCLLQDCPKEPLAQAVAFQPRLAPLISYLEMRFESFIGSQINSNSCRLLSCRSVVGV